MKRKSHAHQHKQVAGHALCHHIVRLGLAISRQNNKVPDDAVVMADAIADA